MPPGRKVVRTRRYTPVVRGSTVYLALHRDARKDNELPPDPDELPDEIEVEYHKGPDGGKQVIDFSQIDHGDE